MTWLLTQPFLSRESQAGQTGVDDVQPATEMPPRFQIGRFLGGSVGTSECPADVYASDDCRLMIVADGLGRGECHHNVSKSVINSLRCLTRRLKSQPSVEQVRKLVNLALVRANAEVVTRARQDGQHKGAGASVVLAVRTGSQLVVKSVGDCRAYLRRSCDFVPLTFDHTLSELLVSTSGTLHSSTSRHPPGRVLLRHLGQHDYLPNDDFRVVNLIPNDRVLFCTRGVTESVSDSELARVIALATTPKRAAKAATIAALTNHARYAAASATLFVS